MPTPKPQPLVSRDYRLALFAGIALLVLVPPLTGQGRAKQIGPAVDNESATILEEIRLPPLERARHDEAKSKSEPAHTFSSESLAAYKSDGVSAEQILKNPHKYPLRAVVLQIVGEVRKLHEKDHDEAGKWEIRGENNDAMKQRIRALQEPIAEREATLRELLDTLEAAVDLKDREPSKRWRAHYDFVVAAIQLRIAALSELNHAYGQVRRDALPPPPEGGKAVGYRLFPSEKMQSPMAVRKLVDKARESLERLAKDHPETPWAVLATRERLTRLGLEWQAIRIE